MPNMSRQPIDRAWFIQRLDEGKKSVRGLARHMEIDASAVSRMLSGQRRMKMEEANSIARFIGRPVSEVLAHAGVTSGGDMGAPQIKLSGCIDEDGNILPIEEPTILPQDVIDRAFAAIGHHSRERVFAVQVRAEHGPLAVWDDAVMFYLSTETIEPASIGTLSVCKTRDGDLVLAKVERARKTGEASIRLTSDAERETPLEWATPVLAIIP